MMTNKDFKKRRKMLLSQIHDNSVVFIFSGQEKSRNNDVNYKYRQSSNFFYLTGINDASTVLVMTKNGRRVSVTLLCNRPNIVDKIWTGQLPSKATYRKEYDIEQVIYFDELKSFQLDDFKNMYFEFNDESRASDFISTLTFKQSGSRYSKTASSRSTKINLSSILFDMRRIKSKNEISQIRHAAKISSSAHINLMKQCKPGLKEYEVEVVFIKYCMSERCEQAYPAIVAAGKNACTLHYTKNDSTLRKNTLLLVDAAAEFDNYASDITRTIPVSGRFNKHQKIIYGIVLKSQMMAINACKPGKTLIDIHNVAVKYITKGLVEAKILKGSINSNIRDETYKKYYMHNTGHWLGLDVHDPSSYSKDGKPITLKPGMIFTVEPGIYINKETGIDKGYHDIGVRIEDDILITNNGCEVLSRDVPKTIQEIENLMSHD